MVFSAYFAGDWMSSQNETLIGLAFSGFCAAAEPCRARLIDTGSPSSKGRAEWLIKGVLAKAELHQFASVS